LPKSSVYGPVASWRLGRSLGIDLLCTETKTCNYDCIYCQLGNVPAQPTSRQEYIPLAHLTEDLNRFKEVPADFVTFSGMGEPTLASNLGEAITLAKSILGLPVAVLTNASMITDEKVRHELSLADMVIAKMDAVDSTMFKKINRPSEGLDINLIIQGLQLFRIDYHGQLALDIMLTDLNKGQAYNLNYYSRLLLPDIVFLNTPSRPCACQGLPDTELNTIRKTWFWNNDKVKLVTESKRPVVEPVDAEETRLRHPTAEKSGATPQT